jgi:hypothetical protein
VVALLGMAALDGVEAVLARLLEIGELPDLARLRAEFVPRKAEVPTVTVETPAPGVYAHCCPASNPIRNHGDHPTQRGRRRPASRFGLRPTRLSARLKTYTTSWDAIQRRPLLKPETPMSSAPNIDGVLIQWGDRLFYPGNRIVKGRPEPRLRAGSGSQRAAAIRARIAATVVQRAPQVMVKVTGGGRGMKTIAAHLRYISKNGRLDIEDERGEVQHGKDALQALADDWRFGGTPIDEVGVRRESFNIMLSIPRGVDPLIVQRAAREFAQAELADHKFVMVLHDHQANPACARQRAGRVKAWQAAEPARG